MTSYEFYSDDNRRAEFFLDAHIVMGRVGINLLSLDRLTTHNLSMNSTVLKSCLRELLSTLIRDRLMLFNLHNVDVGSYLFNSSSVLS